MGEKRKRRADKLLCSAVICLACFFVSPLCGKASAAASAVACASERLEQAALPPSASGMSLEDGREEALRLLQASDYEAAYRFYMELLRRFPGDAEIDYGLALAAQGSGHHSHALLALERLADARPNDASLRVQMARVHARLGDTDAARRELEAAKRLDAALCARESADVIRALNTPSAPSLWKWNGRLSSGLFYDTNANQGPPSPYMMLGIWPLYVEGVESRESWGNEISAAVDVSRRMTPQSAWSLVGDALLYKRWNAARSLSSNREYAWGRTAIGLRYAADSILLDGRVKGELTDEGRDLHIYTWGAELLGIWAPHRRVQLIGRASWEKRFHRLDKIQNGEYWWLGQYLRLFLGNAPHEVMIGVRLLHGRPLWFSGRYAGWDSSLRLTFRPGKRLRISPFVEGGKTWYDGPATSPESTPRADAFVRWGATLSYDLTSRLRAEASWVNGRNWSRSPLYRYTRQTTTVGLSWNF